MSASSGLGGVVGARDLRLQRHAADRAAAGTDLADLRMHRAGVDRAFRRTGFRLRVLLEIFLRVGGEFGPAAGRAEIIGLAAIVEAVLAGRGSTVMPQTGSSTFAGLRRDGMIAVAA